MFHYLIRYHCDHLYEAVVAATTTTMMTSLIFFITREGRRGRELMQAMRSMVLWKMQWGTTDDDDDDDEI